MQIHLLERKRQKNSVYNYKINFDKLNPIGYSLGILLDFIFKLLFHED